MRPLWILCLLACFTGACGRSQPSAASRDPSTAPYPRARWRLATETLHDVTLSFSHILIRHENSSLDQGALGVPRWSPYERTPRSQADALALTRKLYWQLVQAPQQFEALARQHSDDLTSKSQGGVLGPVAAGTLRAPLLDALAALQPGEVSRVVETELGFHLLRRDARPARDKLSAREILISYQATHVLDGHVPKDRGRKRVEAERLAAELASRLRREPSTFEKLVRIYSDANTAPVGGDTGLLNPRRPGLWGREIAALSRVDIGAIAGPVETPYGFKVLLRTAPSPRPSYAALQLRLLFDRDAAPDAPNSRPRVAEQMEALSLQLLKQPDTFDALRARHCCEQPELWEDGRDASFYAALEGLGVGDISERPFESVHAFHLFKRLDPSAVATRAREPLLDLPSPDHVDLEPLVVRLKPRALSRQMRALGGVAAGRLGFAEPTSQRHAALIDALAKNFETRPVSERGLLLTRFQADLTALLGSGGAARYMDVVDQWIVQQIMGEHGGASP